MSSLVGLPLHRCTSSCNFLPLHTSSYLFIPLHTSSLPLHEPLHASSCLMPLHAPSFLVIANITRKWYWECHIEKRELTHLCHYRCRNRSVAVSHFTFNYDSTRISHLSIYIMVASWLASYCHSAPIKIIDNIDIPVSIVAFCLPWKTSNSWHHSCCYSDYHRMNTMMAQLRMVPSRCHHHCRMH